MTPIEAYVTAAGKRNAAVSAAGRQDAGGTAAGKRNAAVSAARSRQDAGATVRPFSFGDVAIRGRGYLPHWEMEGGTYFVTFRLGDSLPKGLLDSFEFERRDILKTAQRLGRGLTPVEKKRLVELHWRMEAALDKGYGACHLARPEIAEMVLAALQHFDGDRYWLVAGCVMPNHVHVVLQPLGRHTLAEILHSWKSFTSKQANKLLASAGEFWEREYYDHLVRSAEQLERIVRYILENPIKAGLKDWRWVWVRNGPRKPT